ncbi:FGGY-family carbohydrate kinase [Halomonas sp. DP5Y7-2]|uniref:FGGY-family carbohydrate kinase n=1 Tax=Halomonas sp. DP5Y7-2 TaxID=2859076 RepID=UPI001C990AE2|nr:FGGY-family carbohydrate kinase [Halomonas sp. DP5Y7-2]MBY5985574.1 FGGY-family carbohydrate kinase [Halomonas sp. DP5Y7-2]
METVIGIDIGTQSAKVLIIDAGGRILASRQHGYRVDTPYPRWAEQWPEVWWQAIVDGIRDCLKAPGIDPDSVKALCISSLYGGSGIAVNADMTPLHPCLIWMDRRAEAEVQWVKQHIDLERLEAITGNGVDSYYGFTKMLWLKRHRPEVWANTRHLLPPNSYMAYLLTGEVAVDHSSAGNIGGIYDLANRCWSEEMTTALGIELDKLPERLVDSDASIGTLTEAAARWLGLPPGIPVVAGGVDAAMATLAAGATSTGHHVAMIGTSMCWGFIRQQLEPTRGLVSMPHVHNGSRDIYTFGGALTAGASLSWCLDVLFGEDHDPDAAYAMLEPAAAALSPGADGLVFLPYLMGERSPLWDARASAAFFGLNLTHRRQHLYRAVLEGVAYALRHNMEAAATMDASLAPGLIVVGGVTHSDLWMQIIADVTGREVFTYRDDVEAAFGAALLAGQHVDLLSLEPSCHRPTLVPRAQPDAQAMSRYDVLYGIYRDLYPSLAPLMHRLDALRSSSLEEPSR